MLTILRSTKFHLLLIILLTVLAYSNIFQNEFVIDDKTFIVNWEKGRSISNIFEFFKGEVPKGHEGVYRPIRSVFYALYYQVFGTNPFFYHLHSIAAHVISTILVYKIILLILNLLSRTKSSKTVNQLNSRSIAGKAVVSIDLPKYAAFIGGLLFGLHPIHTETITYISASMDATGIVFFFASFYFYLRKASPFEAIFAFLAFFTYEMTLTLPILLFLYEICFNHNVVLRTKSQILYFIQNNIKKIFPYFFLAFLYLFIRFVVLDITSRGFYLAGSFYLTFLASIKVFLKYLTLSIFPFGQAHNHTISKNIEAILYRGHNLDPIISQRFFDLGFLFALFVFIFVVVLAFKTYKKGPLISFGILWFTVSLFPILNIIPQASLMHEKFLYIPSFGLVLLAVHFVLKVKERRYLLMLIPVLFLFLFLTLQRNKVWKDPVTFWTIDAKKSEKNAYAYFQLGEAYDANKEYGKAVDSYKKAFEINPNFAVAIASAARTYQVQGELEPAIENYEKAMRADPNFREGKANLDRIYSSLDKSLIFSFSFSYPKTWKKTEEGGNTFVKNEKGDFVISFKKERKNPSAPVEEYLSLKTSSYGSLVNQGLAKVPNFDLAYVKIWKDGAISKHQFFLFRDDKVIEAFVYPSDSDLMKEFDKIIESIEL